jgi:hypothetical protein
MEASDHTQAPVRTNLMRLEASAIRPKYKPSSA